MYIYLSSPVPMEVVNWSGCIVLTCIVHTYSMYLLAKYLDV